MGTSFPRRCPFCESNDVRAVRMSSEELTGFLCRDCDQIFFVGALKPTRAATARARRLRAPVKRKQAVRRRTR
jgi:transposase-like protein